MAKNAGDEKSEERARSKGSSKTKSRFPKLKKTLGKRVETTKLLVKQPSQARNIFTQLLVDGWRSKGGGLYGLGYLCTFVYFEARTFGDEIAAAEDFLVFFSTQIVGLFFRLLADSLGNMIQAVLWPLLLLNELGAAIGLGLLLGLYITFEYAVRPIVEKQYPQLAGDRTLREQAKRDKRKAQLDKKIAKADAKKKRKNR